MKKENFFDCKEIFSSIPKVLRDDVEVAEAAMKKDGESFRSVLKESNKRLVRQLFVYELQNVRLARASK